jgi:hypothetical protein
MISYVLVLIESLTTGQLTQAYLEGPMSDSWCAQLIERAGYAGDDGTSRRLPSCVSWPAAQQMLLQHLCRHRHGPAMPGRRHFDCEPPVPTAVSTTALAPAEPQIASLTHRSYAPTQQVRSDEPPPLPPVPSQPEAQPQPELPLSRPPRKPFHLGPAASALVTQARTQAGSGHYDLAAATIERALRIEPENPLVWVELGRLRMHEGDAAQANGIERKALALATGDSQVQADAWRLVAESLRAQGRNQEAAEADRNAASLSVK